MKKSQVFTLIFLLRLIVAIVLVLFIFAIARKCVGNTSEARVSFEKLVNKINTIQEGELLSMPLVMDGNTMIIFFNKGSDEIKYTALEGYRSKVGKTYEIIKGNAEDCSKESGCSCLYYDLPSFVNKSEDYYKTYKVTIPVNLEAPLHNKYCKRVNSDLFYSPGFYAILLSTGHDIALQGNYKFEGGLVIQRGRVSDKPLWDKEIIKAPHYPRLRTVYIEKYQGVIGVCKWHPCLTEENKKEIDALFTPSISDKGPLEYPLSIDYGPDIPDPVDIDI